MNLVVIEEHQVRDLVFTSILLIHSAKGHIGLCYCTNS